MELNTENMKKIQRLIIFTVIVVVIGVNYQKVIWVAGLLFNLISPFILGGAIAFVLNVPMRLVEGCLPIKKKKARRGISLVLTLVIVTGVVVLVSFVVTPQLFYTLRSLQGSVPRFFLEIQTFLEQTFSNEPAIENLINSFQIDWPQLLSDTVSFLRSGATSFLSGTISAAVSFVSGVTTFIIALVFAIYILAQKEELSRQMKKLIQAFFSDSASEWVFKVASLTGQIFSSFLTGQCVEAVILGTMFFVSLMVLRLPYALLIGVLIAFTALIPIFGAFIGFGVGAFLMLMNDPMDALIFAVTFLILQQVEGNLIYPHVVGGSVGLPSIWVLAAVTVGGSAFGIVGMLVFIPLCSVLYALLKEEVNRRLELKKRGKISPKVPGHTAKAAERKGKSS
ncbi:MAG TPA: AI-2E family transporter [Candidatus Cottocaccamicrobium excrementipullorum]|nr:AI-2E family transporter [Candidatus Cottocaccamicrobium excrementipullorum]